MLTATEILAAAASAATVLAVVQTVRLHHTRDDLAVAEWALRIDPTTQVPNRLGLTVMQVAEGDF
ncbi:hypothetical protein [Saccharopolyspora hattusasensis]|uniref:hypothetical protein n=1 Tax=Saccharopolyspora hattusasensis TaxID=1128679 RepID=UPI003D98EB62